MEVGLQTSARPRDERPSVWVFGRAELDDHRHELRVDGRAVAFESKPYALLRVLVQRSGETLSKEELIESVWPGRVVTEGVLAKCIAKLRAALGDDDQSLIRTVHGYGYRLTAPVSTRAAAAAGPEWAPSAGEAVPSRPNWRFVRELRKGGFGLVWLGEHAKTHERRVFKFAGDGAELQALKREITLYRLLHDSLGDEARIVRLIDWNIDEPPYFVESEYIGGGDLGSWCEARGFAAFGRAVRLEIIARIADALAAAHALGVLHKDLKPANVLITDVDDDCPGIRLVDFGSGRALEPERLAALGITRLGLSQTHAAGDSTSGTPYYLAPELLAGRVPSVRADIYALGVMLYQILVGDFRAPLAPGWERDIAPGTLAGAAAIEGELLCADIAAAADLDPERRLGDAGELARRLRELPQRCARVARERVAADEAQRQQRQMLRWRASRRWLLALTAVMGSAVGAVGWLYLREQREAAIEHAVSSFLRDDLLAAADPYATQRSDLRVRDVLDRARASVAARFAGRPAQEAAIRTTLGNGYHGIGEYAEADRQFERALELLGGPASRSAQGLALRRAIADNAVSATRYADAAAAFTGLLADVGARDGADSDAALDVRLAQAHLQLRRGRSAAARAAIEHLLPLARARFGADADATLEAATDLGEIYRVDARFDAAETLYRQVFDARRARLGASHWLTLQAQQDLAQLARARGRLDEAVALEQAVVAGRQKAFGREHEETLNALNELASMYQDQNRLDLAEPLFREVLAARERTLGERHEHTRNSMNNLALVLSREGKREEAGGLYRRALAIEQQVAGPDDLQVLILMHNLAGLERDGGNYAEAERLERGVIDGASRSLAPERPERGLFLVGLARVLQAQKKYPGAAATFDQARAILVAAYGPQHARVVKLDGMRAALYRDWGRPLPDAPVEPH